MMHHLPGRLVKWGSEYKIIIRAGSYIAVPPTYKAGAMGFRL